MGKALPPAVKAERLTARSPIMGKALLSSLRWRAGHSTSSRLLSCTLSGLPAGGTANVACLADPPRLQHGADVTPRPLLGHINRSTSRPMSAWPLTAFVAALVSGRRLTSRSSMVLLPQVLGLPSGPTASLSTR